ncbi:MAG: phosphate signaling complex PhoU family protein [Bacteroidia bacterium]
MLSPELKEVKKDILHLCILVQAQMHKAKETLLKFDKDLGYEVIMNEQKIDSWNLRIKRDCESMLSVFRPTAKDLRFILAAFKIVHCLGRCADFAGWVSLYISEMENSFDKSLLKSCNMVEIFEEIDAMMYAVHQSIEKDDSLLLQPVFERDEIIGRYRLMALDAISKYIQKKPDQSQRCLYLFSVVMKLERVGDQLKSMAHEVIFYSEAAGIK